MTRKRRNAITWKQFYESTKDSSCYHLETDCKKERFLINSFFLCEECMNKYKKFGNSKALFKREIGQKLKK